MSQLGNDLEKWGSDVIFGRARGFGAFVARSIFRCLSFVYAFVVGMRLKAYRQHWKEQSHLGTMVISVGNLTVGGTGKTPVVEMLSRSLRDRGRQVAILSRGYKSKKLGHLQQWKNWDADRREEMPKVVSDGNNVLLDAAHAGDEPFMLAKNLSGVSVIVDKDRVNGGRFAVTELGADTLVLDDGLQYLKINHEFDIVLVDQNAPFGTGAILPRGTLREPPRNLCRASHIILTKCQGPTDDELLKRIHKYNPAAEIIETTHEPCYLQQVFGEGRLPLEHLDEAYIAAISGIAVPESFEGLLKKLNADVEFHRTFGDHQTFPQRDVDRFMTRCIERDIEMILTTEKDAVRFPRPKELDVPIYFLRIEIKILRGQEVWDRLIDQICGSHERAPGQWDVERLLLNPIGP